MAKKKLTTGMQTMDDFEKGIFKLNEKIEEIFADSEWLVQIIKKIAYEMSVIGLSEKEACLISSYSPDKFIELKHDYPIIQQLIDIKDLEYKRGLLKNISGKALESDDKLAQWLLEARYPNEFNRAKKGGGGSQDDNNDQKMIGMALDFVRKHGDKNSLISEESGRAFVIKTSKIKEKDITDIQQFLD